MDNAYPDVRTATTFVDFIRIAVLYKLHGSLCGYLEHLTHRIAHVQASNQLTLTVVTICPPPKKEKARLPCFMRAGIAQWIQRLAKD